MALELSELKSLSNPTKFNSPKQEKRLEKLKIPTPTIYNLEVCIYCLFCWLGRSLWLAPLRLFYIQYSKKGVEKAEFLM